MPRLPIITVPNPTLRQKSASVDAVTPRVANFIKNLEETLQKKTDPPGVGLSAIQVAEPLRIFTLYLPKNYRKEESPKASTDFVLTTFINPEIIDKSDQYTLGPNPQKPIMEGCLSIPDIYGPVLRHQWIELKYYTLSPAPYTLVEHTIHLFGFAARVAEHEQDHLDGILFTDRSLAQNQPLFEDQDGEFVQIKLG